MYCDICKREFTDKEAHAIMQFPSKLYDAILKGEHILIDKHDEEDIHPFFRRRDDVQQFDVCIECVRILVSLKLQIEQMYKHKMV